MMGKLVLINESTKEWITVSDKDQIIGRGDFLACTDKRVSRNHGIIRSQLQGPKTLLFLQALHHTNPIFYRKNNDTQEFILKEDDTILLDEGEKFRLLPDGIWFEVKYECEPDSTENGLLNAEITASKSNKDPNDSMLPAEDSSKRKHEADTSEDNTKRPREASDDQPSTSSAVPQAYPSVKPDPDSSSTGGMALPVTIKPDPDNVPSDSNSNQVTIKPEPDGSNSNAGISTLNSVGNVSVIRPSCDFGIRCYRGGSDHRAMLAHPGDLDYRRPNFPPAPPGSPLCPFGVRCYRRNPQHFRDFNHPDPSVSFIQSRPVRLIVHRTLPVDDFTDDEYYEDSDIDFGETSSDEYSITWLDENSDGDEE
ncbi:aprataxin and PNK-like factor [Anopheles nili]|uniref:aprataxin and PNK-like factor n=1 Tax=Anopheles nili TaxID=185578 RepID=UPI00237C2582|nr:aprataxin and PNK-like factor [Anopheles nili]